MSLTCPRRYRCLLHMHSSTTTMQPTIPSRRRTHTRRLRRRRSSSLQRHTAHINLTSRLLFRPALTTRTSHWSSRPIRILSRLYHYHTSRCLSIRLRHRDRCRPPHPPLVRVLLPLP
jgi:hypothetical protein